MILISKREKKDILNLKLYAINPDISDKTYSFEEDYAGNLVLNYHNEVILCFTNMKDFLELFMKVNRAGTNSDMFYWGDVEIGFIGQLFKENILEWKETDYD